ncbi:MAG: universal stress protein [Planctomyces sp.]|nr:universal stress protein [Planctomyces sp.]
MDSRSTYNRILVAVDFSLCGAAALKQAVWLARRSGSRIVLAHVISKMSQYVHYGTHNTELKQQELLDGTDAALRRLIVDLNAMDLNVTFKKLFGEPFVEITKAVQESDFDLVLAGTRGSGMLEQFFVGSTAKRLIRKCPSSVWVVKAEHLVPPKVVLAATDFSEVSLKAVKEGLETARQADAEFHLLHVIDSRDVPEDLISRIPKGSSLKQEINEAAGKRMEEFLNLLSVDRSRIQVHLSWGTPWHEIQRMSRHQAADLIVIGTVGRSGIRGLFLGNTAEKVLDTCDCSILTVKPAGFVSPIG